MKRSEIEIYMKKVISNLNNKEILRKLCYSEKDKDCGYRSALRLFKIKRTHETDKIANYVIYGKTKTKGNYIKKQEQLTFCFKKHNNCSNWQLLLSS
jgi:hypothetical protein